jgi:DNA-binding NtrC family response regulator
VREQLEKLIGEMVEKGILFVDAQREFEKRFIARVLHNCHGNLSQAALVLGIHRNTLGRKMAEYRLRK